RTSRSAKKSDRAAWKIAHKFIATYSWRRTLLSQARMPYGLIALIGSIALTAVYVLVSEARLWSKILISVLLGVSFVWRYGLFLQVALGLFLSLYFTYLRSRW